ncbi:MAG: nicotinate-nucleotide adenylyltransferase [Clostridia bacterium]|nr:nicotinate-nucleotide adenylyltransferase [Clostridia bacterium]
MRGAKRVAILGGTFNPIHNGHIYLARAFAELLNLDEVQIMIANTPPHKAAPDLASNEHRLNMVRLAQQAEPVLRPCDLELKRAGKSYTYATLRHLCRRNPDTEYYFLTGADMFLTIHQWKRPLEIFHRAVICTSPRDAQGYEELKAFEPFLNKMGARTVVADFSPPPISSTQVRNAICAGEPVDDLIPANIAEYIRRHGLYGGGTDAK